MKKQALSLAVMIVGAYPAASNALSLGDIESNSNLNQPLSAKIELLAAGAQEAEQLQVRLAPSSVFNRVGIDRPAFLDNLNFTTAVQNGKPVILITSNTPISEPFVNFLLEVTWPQGQLLKEYTVMLDPPVLMQPGTALAGSEAAVRAEPRSAGTVSRAEPRPAAQRQQQVAVEQVQDEVVAQPQQASHPQVASTRRAAPAQAPVATRQAASASSADNGGGSRTYRVRPRDTLFKVASQLAIPGANVDQVMLAIYRANPQAFIDGNINGLKTGTVLRAPAASLAQSVTRAEARRQVRQQYADWKKFRSALAKNTVPQQPIQASRTERTAEPVSRSNASRGDKARLEVLGNRDKASAGDKVSAAGKERLATLEKELSLARESLVSQQRENTELKSRADDLESMLRKKNRLIALRDDQLAELQRQMSGATPATAQQPNAQQTATPPDTAQQDNPLIGSQEPVAPTPVNAAVNPDVSPAKPDGSDIQNYIGNVTQNGNDVVRAQPPTSVNAGLTDPQAMTPAQRAAAAANGGVPPANPQAMTPAQRAAAAANGGVQPPANPQAMTPAQRAAAAANGGLQTNTPPAALQPAPAVKPTAPVPKPPSPFVEQQGDDLLSLLTSPLAWKIGAGALLSLLLLWLLSRLLGRKKKREVIDNEFIDPPFAGVDEPRIPEINANTNKPFGDLGKELDKAERKPKAISAAFDDDPFGMKPDGVPVKLEEFEQPVVIEDGDEDEVLMEANVYIAYGLHQQAESELKKALEKYPERLEYRHKLLENYFAANNREAFEEHAKLFADTKGFDRNGKLWRDISAWGSKISPDNRLFKANSTSGAGVGAAVAAAGVAVGAVAAAGVSAKEAAVDDAASLVNTATSAVSGGAEATVQGSAELDLGKDLETALSNTGDLGDFDFNLDDLERELGGSDLGFQALDHQDKPADDLFDLDERVSTPTAPLVSAQADKANEADAVSGLDNFDALDLDFGDLDPLNDPKHDPALNGFSADLDNANNSLDFDLDSLAMDAPATSTSLVNGAAGLAAAGVAGVVGVAAAATDKVSNVTSLNLHLDKDSGIKKILPQDTFYTAPDAPNPDDDWLGDIDEALSFLDMPDEEIDLHEAHISTKLDLARAYLDMGDIEGARSTLEEVMVEGNDNQRREAETLLHQTG